MKRWVNCSTFIDETAFCNLKKNAELVCAMLWVNLKSTKTTEEINKNPAYYMISLICNAQRGASVQTERLMVRDSGGRLPEKMHRLQGIF